MEIEEKEVDLQDYLKVLYKWRKLILVIFVCGTVAVILYSFFLPKVYECESIIQSGSVENNSIKQNDIEFLFKSSSILNPILEQFNKKYNKTVTIKSFKGWIKVTDFNDTRFSLITRAQEPEIAREINEQLIEQYFGFMISWFDRRMKHLNQKIKINESSLIKIENSGEELKREIENFVRERKLNPEPAFKTILLRSLYSQYINEISQYQEKELELQSKLNEIKEFKVLEVPVAPKYPKSPNKKNWAVAGALISLLTGIFAAFVIEYFRKINIKG